MIWNHLKQIYVIPPTVKCRDLYIKKSPNDRNFPIISWLNISHFQIAIFWHNTLCQSRKKGSSSSTGEKEICSTKTHSKTFPACFYIPIFFPIWIIIVLILDLRNLQEQKKTFCYQRLVSPFTVWIDCSNDLKNFENYRLSVLNFKSFSRSLEQFFLTVGQNNFGNKIPFLYSIG